MEKNALLRKNRRSYIVEYNPTSRDDVTKLKDRCRIPKNTTKKHI